MTRWTSEQKLANIPNCSHTNRLVANSEIWKVQLLVSALIVLLKNGMHISQWRNAMLNAMHTMWNAGGESKLDRKLAKCYSPTNSLAISHRVSRYLEWYVTDKFSRDKIFHRQKLSQTNYHIYKCTFVGLSRKNCTPTYYLTDKFSRDKIFHRQKLSPTNSHIHRCSTDIGLSRQNCTPTNSLSTKFHTDKLSHRRILFRQNFPPANALTDKISHL